MSRGRIRTLIPLAYEDLNQWPCPNESVLPNNQLTQFRRRKEAIELYSDGISYQSILEQTGVRRAEMRRLIERCLIFNGRQILGFYALLPYTRIKPYSRTAPIKRVLGENSRGCAGALQMLLRQFPEIDVLIHRLLFKRAFRGVHENKIPFLAIRDAVLEKLRELKFTDAHWPFNTVNRGYNAISVYCRELIQKHPVDAAAARYGKSAAKRLKIGRGFKRLLPEPRWGAHMALDFHVVDAASIITILNNFGVEIQVPVARWYIGLIINPKSSAIFGFHISLELNPSADCFMETLQCALIPPEFVDGDPRKVQVKDGKILVSQLIPELTWQGFAALFVDNAWSNCASDVVNNTMDCVGCAINFGPAGEWWRRPYIERIFGEIFPAKRDCNLNCVTSSA
jgi:putative transposase